MSWVLSALRRFGLGGGWGGHPSHPGDRAPRGTALASLPRLTRVGGTRGRVGATLGRRSRSEGGFGSRFSSRSPSSGCRAIGVPSTWLGASWRPLLAIGVWRPLLLLAFCLLAPPPASAQTVGAQIKTSDGTTEQPRLTIESGSATVNAYFQSASVGVGIAAPQGPFQVQLPAWTSRDTDSQHVIINNSADNNYGIRFGFTSTGGYGVIDVLNPGVAWGNLILQDDPATAGNVGIGTTVPGTKLHIESTVNPARLRVRNPDAAGDKKAQLELLGDTDVVGSSDLGKGAVLRYDGSSNNIELRGIAITSAADEPLGVAIERSTGNVAVGAAASSSGPRLSVLSAASGTVQIGAASGGIDITSIAGESLRLGSNGTEYLTILGSGNPGYVGIGNTNPAYKLTVAGDVALTSGALGFTSGTFTVTQFSEDWGIYYPGDATHPFQMRSASLMVGYSNAGLGGTNWGSGNGYFSGNVGIGTTGPSVKLHVTGSPSGSYTRAGNATFGSTISGEGQGSLNLNGTTFDSTAGAGHISTNLSYENGAWVQRNTGFDGWIMLQRTQSDGAGSLQFWHAAKTTGTLTEFMRLDSSGNLGIGVTSPGAAVDIDRANPTSNSELINLRSNSFTQTLTASLSNPRTNQFLATEFTAGSAVTVTDAATVYIERPFSSGSASMSNSCSLLFGNQREQRIFVQSAANDTAGMRLRIRAGGAGAATVANSGYGGGELLLLGGDATQTGSGVGAGGNITLFGGTGVGGGARGNIYMANPDGNVGIGATASVLSNAKCFIKGNGTQYDFEVYSPTSGDLHALIAAESDYGGAGNLKFYVRTDGNVYADGTYYGAGGVTAGSADLAERFPHRGEAPEPGEIVHVVPATPDENARIRAAIDRAIAESECAAHPPVFTSPVECASEPYASDVVGIVSTDPGYLMSGKLPGVPVALAGRVPAKVTLEGGPIRVGDLLTTSSTPGHAMKATEPWRGGIIGTALESFGLDETGTTKVAGRAPRESRPFFAAAQDIVAPSHTGKIIVLVHLNPAPSADPNLVAAQSADLAALRLALNERERAEGEKAAKAEDALRLATLAQGKLEARVAALEEMVRKLAGALSAREGKAGTEAGGGQ